MKGFRQHNNSLTLAALVVLSLTFCLSQTLLGQQVASLEAAPPDGAVELREQAAELASDRHLLEVADSSLQLETASPAGAQPEQQVAHHYPPEDDIARDLAPWRGRPITLDHLYLTRARIVDDVPFRARSRNTILSVYIRRGIPMFVTKEISALEGSAPILKARDLMTLLWSVAATGGLPNTVLLFNLQPWPVQPSMLYELRGDGMVNDSSGAEPTESEPRIGWTSARGPHALPPLPLRARIPLDQAPVFSMCKTDDWFDVLAPNVFYGSLEAWGSSTQLLSRAAAASPLSRRQHRVWWRGASGWSWPAAEPRVRVVGAYHRRPYADFAFTNNWKEQLRSWKGAPWRASLPPGVAGVRHGKEKLMTTESIALYRYALHLPGSFAGTYSRTLQTLLWTGSTTLFFDSPYYEHYYRQLRPWVHYVPFSTSDLDEKVAWAEAHESEVEAIAGRARDFAADHLTAEAIGDYWRSLLGAYNKLLAEKPATYEGACTCWNEIKPKPVRIPAEVVRCPRKLCDVSGG